MASPSGTTNQENPLSRMSFVFPPYGDVGPPLMATLSFPGLTIGLLVWLFSSPVIPCTPVASDPIPSLQEHQLMLIPLLLHQMCLLPFLPLRLLKVVVLVVRWIRRRRKTNKKQSLNQLLLWVCRVLIYTPQDRISPNSLVGFSRVITFWNIVMVSSYF